MTYECIPPELELFRFDASTGAFFIPDNEHDNIDYIDGEDNEDYYY